MMIASFLFFLAIFVLIGVSSVFFHQKNNSDYLLAGSSVKPWLVALSAVATNNSGYMFIGLIGFTYAFGLQAIWTAIGWVVGDFIISFVVHKKLRQTTESQNVLSFNGVLANWNNTDFQWLRRLGGFITLCFLGTYAAAQLSAGSKALHVLFDWDYEIGAIMGAVMVMVYCFAGGLRASIWTDAAQSFVMFFAMAIMLGMAVLSVGGTEAFIAQLDAVSPEYLNWFPEGLAFGTLPFIIGWLFAGFGVIGQPHIMVRFMAMDTPESMGRVRAYYYSWYSIFFAMGILTGMAARLLIPMDGSFDAELALPSLAVELLPPMLVGLVLAGLFAATMSTADSQIISCTAAITRDLVPGKIKNYWLTKGITVLVTALALTISLYGPDSVFTLVVIAWAALASAFGPLLIVYAFGGRPRQGLAIVMMVGGVAAMAIWRQLGLSDAIYEILPGMVAGLAIYGIGHLAGWILPPKSDTNILKID